MMATWKRIVRKCDVRPNEHIVLKSHPIPLLYAALDRDTIADLDVVFDKYMVGNIAVIPDNRARQNMGKSPDPRATADLVGLDKGMRMLEVISHRFLCVSE